MKQMKTLEQEGIECQDSLGPNGFDNTRLNIADVFVIKDVKRSKHA